MPARELDSEETANVSEFAAMPLIQFSMNCLPAAEPSASDVDVLLGEVCHAAAKVLGKPESVMMVRLSFDAGCMGESTDPSCCVLVKQIGAFEVSARSELARILTWHAAERLGVAEERVFVLFEAVDGSHWAKGGRLIRPPTPTGS